MTVDPLIWAIVLLMLGLALVVLELFVPSYGFIGFCAVCCIGASIYFAFQRGTGYGITFLILALVAGPSCFILTINVWPDTPIGRRVLIGVPKAEELLPDSPQRRRLQQLVGKTGRARSLMLPSGAAEIEGRVFDAVSEGMAIEAGQLVRVIEVRGNRVVVRLASEEESRHTDDDDLSRPIDTLGLDPFEDPIA